MKEKFNFQEIVITKKQSNQRLDSFLGQTDFIKNRSQALHIIKKNFVTLKGKPLKSSYHLREGDKLLIKISKKNEDKIPFYSFPVEIIYEDSSLIVVNKPAGLVVHPAPGHEGDTLVNVLSKKNLSSGSSALRPGIVHRLDKDTSGLLVLAKDKKVEEDLINQFKQRSIKRVYEALSFSSPSALKGTIESYIGRHKTHRKKFISSREIRPLFKKAISHYSVLKTSLSGISLIECILETGRTHQIRVHMASLLCPLLGDKIYGKPKFKNIKSKELVVAIKNLNRIALHAKTLGFIHPKTSKEMFFERSWPLDIRPLLKKLQFLE